MSNPLTAATAAEAQTVVRNRYTIYLTGNWCAGVYWQIIDLQTGRVVKEEGPYHQAAGRMFAFNDAVLYADQNNLPVDSEVNWNVDPWSDGPVR